MPDPRLDTEDANITIYHPSLEGSTTWGWGTRGRNKDVILSGWTWLPWWGPFRHSQEGHSALLIVKNKLVLYIMNKHFFSILNRLSFVKRDQNRLIIIRAYFIEKLHGMFLVVRLTCLFSNCLLPNCLFSCWSFPPHLDLHQCRHCVYQSTAAQGLAHNGGHSPVCRLMFQEW